MEDSSKTRGEFENVDKVDNGHGHYISVNNSDQVQMIGMNILYLTIINGVHQYFVIIFFVMTIVKYIYQVEKFELGKEEYSKRTDTVQVFIFKYNFYPFA